MSSDVVWGYIRCSTQEQGDSGLSLEGQRARIEAWCEATGTPLGEIVEDRGVSGSRSLQARPGGRRIAELLGARDAEIHAVVVVRLDRLGRDAAETLKLLKTFANGPIGLVSIADRLDLTTPQGRAMAGISAVFAELERALIAERTAEALRRLREQGRIYGPVPFGFNSIGGRLVPNSSEQATLESIGAMRARGISYGAIAEWLNSEAIASKRGGRWYAMSVRSVLMTTEGLRETSERSAA